MFARVSGQKPSPLCQHSMPLQPMSLRHTEQSHRSSKKAHCLTFWHILPLLSQARSLCLLVHPRPGPSAGAEWLLIRPRPGPSAGAKRLFVLSVHARSDSSAGAKQPLIQPRQVALPLRRAGGHTNSGCVARLPSAARSLCRSSAGCSLGPEHVAL